VYLLENCGRFLIRHPESKMRFSHLLDVIMKLKNNKILQSNVIMSIENAYFLCKPPAGAALKKRRERSDLEEYIRHLIYSKINDPKKVCDTILRLPLNTCEGLLLHYMIKIVYKGRFTQMQDVVAVLAYLQQKCNYVSIAAKVVDATLEEVLPQSIHHDHTPLDSEWT
jgi:regulator of nonsense transcripts 2